MPGVGGNNRLRVVLDTNTLVSALAFPHGRIAPIWQRAIQRQYCLLLSPALAHELARVLRDRFHWDNEPLYRLIRLLARVGEVIQPSAVVPVIPRDSDDDQILACALAGRAHLIVSGDRHLLDLANYQGIAIVRPMDFLRTLGAVSPPDDNPLTT